MLGQGAAQGVTGTGADTYLMTDTVDDRFEIPANTDGPVQRFDRLATRVESQRHITMGLWSALLVANLAFGIWGLLIYDRFTANAQPCERAIRHILLAAGIAFVLAAFFVILSMVQLGLIFSSFIGSRASVGPRPAPRRGLSISGSGSVAAASRPGGGAAVPNDDDASDEKMGLLEAVRSSNGSHSGNGNANGNGSGARKNSGGSGRGSRSGSAAAAAAPAGRPASKSAPPAPSASAELEEVVIDEDKQKYIAATITDNIFMACCSCGYLICLTIVLLILVIILLTWVYFEHNDCNTASPVLVSYSRPFAIATICLIVLDAVWFRFACMTCPYVYDIYTVEQQMSLMADSQNKLRHLRTNHPGSVASGGALIIHPPPAARPGDRDHKDSGKSGKDSKDSKDNKDNAKSNAARSASARP